jgi:replication-associated recombination protein RarA
MPVRSIHDKKGSQHYITVKAPKKSASSSKPKAAPKKKK